MTLFLIACILALSYVVYRQWREVARLRQLPIGFESVIAQTGEHVLLCIYCAQRMEWGHSLATIDTNDQRERPRLEPRGCDHCGRQIPGDAP